MKPNEIIRTIQWALQPIEPVASVHPTELHDALKTAAQHPGEWIEVVDPSEIINYHLVSASSGVGRDGGAWIEYRQSWRDNKPYICIKATQRAIDRLPYWLGQVPRYHWQPARKTFKYAFYCYLQRN
jgi:hypothetical protein